MILACPSCATRFRVPEEALGASGRRVRCSVCRREWRVPPEGAPRPPRAVSAPAPTPAPALPPRSIPEAHPGPAPSGEPPGLLAARATSAPGRRRGWTVLWLALLLVAGAALAAVVIPDRTLGRIPHLAPYLEWLGLAQDGTPAAGGHAAALMAADMERGL